MLCFLILHHIILSIILSYLLYDIISICLIFSNVIWCFKLSSILYSFQGSSKIGRKLSRVLWTIILYSALNFTFDCSNSIWNLSRIVITFKKSLFKPLLKKLKCTSLLYLIVFNIFFIAQTLKSKVFGTENEDGKLGFDQASPDPRKQYFGRVAKYLQKLLLLGLLCI